MQKKDCLFVTLDLCRGGQIDHRQILRSARTKSKKLILITTCGAPNDVFHVVRSIASENMDLPIRHYHGVEVDTVASLEKCADFEVLNLETIIGT